MRALLRSATGPAILALGAWAAAGTIAPVAIATPDVRAAIPGPAIWPVAVFVLALLFPPLRRWPVVSTPAVLPLLPWLPLPLPAIAYLWTGKLAWLPIALPVVGALLLQAGTRRPSTDAFRRPRRDAALAALLTLIVASLTAFSLRWSLPAGDEPHYLIITQSLLQDGDLRIENNHAARDYAPYFAGTIDPQSLRRGTDGEIYPVHLPGVSVLVLPLFALFGYRGAQATIVLAAAATGALVWAIGWLTTRDRGAAWFAWAAVVGSTTLLAESVSIFPDLPGALAAASAAAVIVALARGRRVSSGAIVAAGLTLTAMPFLHARFALLAAAMGLVLAAGILRPGSDSRSLDRRTAIWCFAVPAVAGASAWLAYFWTIYGTVDPRAPYGTAPETSLGFVPGGLLGLAFDQQFGLFAYSPVLAAAFLPQADRRLRGTRVAGALLGAAVVYTAGVATYWMWWAGGPVPPARFVTAVLPLFAASLALAWQKATASQRHVLLVLLGTSLAITAIAIFADEGRLFANHRDGRALWLDWLGGVLDLPRLWPSFFQRLDPGRLETEWAFAAHAGIWIAAFAIGAGLLWMRLRENAAAQPSASSMALAVWWVPACLVVAGNASIGFNHDQPLRPVLVQLDTLSRARRGDTTLFIAPARVSRADTAVPVTRIVVPRVEAPDAGVAEWLVLPDVPAGVYDVTIRLKRPRDGGELAVRQGRAPVPLATFALTSQSVQQFSLELSADVRAMWLVPNDVLASVGESIELVPRALAPVHP